MDHGFIRLSRINNLNKPQCFKAPKPGLTLQVCSDGESLAMWGDDGLRIWTSSSRSIADLLTFVLSIILLSMQGCSSMEEHW